MQKTQSNFQILLGLLLLGLLGWGGFHLLREIWSIFKSLDPKLAAGMAAASATILVSVITVVFSKRQEHKVEIASQLRDKKIPIYENIIQLLFRITFAEKLGEEQPTEEELMRVFTDTTRDLVIWGSIEMVNAFGLFRERLINWGNGDPSEVMIAVEDLMFSIRKDLGHKSGDTKRGDILRLYINDVNDYFPRP